MWALAAYWKALCAVAIVTASPWDPQEQRQLARIARYESNFIPRLGAPRCECRAWECDNGRAKGAWQHLSDRCPFSLEADARIALRHVRASVAACGRGPNGLAIYARGRCDSDEGRALSRVRYAE